MVYPKLDSSYFSYSSSNTKNNSRPLSTAAFISAAIAACISFAASTDLGLSSSDSGTQKSGCTITTTSPEIFASNVIDFISIRSDAGMNSSPILTEALTWAFVIVGALSKNSSTKAP